MQSTYLTGKGFVVICFQENERKGKGFQNKEAVKVSPSMDQSPDHSTNSFLDIFVMVLIKQNIISILRLVRVSLALSHDLCLSCFPSVLRFDHQSYIIWSWIEISSSLSIHFCGVRGIWMTFKFGILCCDFIFCPFFTSQFTS